MDTQTFWNIIKNYNEQTAIIQIGLFIFLVLAIILSYAHKINQVEKFALGIANLFIAVVFYVWQGTETIQKFFALPLFLLCGILFLYESWHNKDDSLKKPNCWQSILLLLYLIYPFISILLGNRFPQMVTYIMPCPIASLSIIVYSCYNRKNKLLLLLLSVWGLTGIKSVFLNVFEDIILLICGLYGVVLFVNEIKQLKKG
ncbi:MAG: DUF6064 family protein [Oscillospiraceae bacterium]|nr:DUF6064 family protein [Oscillospiraceae bacterium]